MSEKRLSENQNKYHVVRHHAWAGSVLLAILLAVRILMDISEYSFEHIDLIMLALGTTIIFYTISSLILTYKYRSNLSNEKTVQIISSSGDLEKEKIKIEKKKSKAETKKVKKSNKK